MVFDVNPPRWATQGEWWVLVRVADEAVALGVTADAAPSEDEVLPEVTERVVLTPGYEHPGDPRQPDNTHKH